MRLETGNSPDRAAPHAKGALLPCGRARPVAEKPRATPAALVAALVERFEAFCLEEGLRTSHARRKIVEVIVSDLQHFTTQALATRMARHYPEVGRATLYRTIPFLVKAGILQEGPKTVEGLPSYELAETRHHDHIVCLDCREIFEFESRRIEKEQDRVTEEQEFVPERHTHVIYARCARLDRKRRPR